MRTSALNRTLLWLVRVGVSAGACALVACTDSAGPGNCAVVSGQIATNGGSAQALDNYTINVSAGSFKFSNLNATFYTGANEKELVDVGKVCLSDVTAWPGAGSTTRIAVTVGHAYILKVVTTTIVNGVESTTTAYSRFVVNGYSGGVVTLVYAPM